MKKLINLRNFYLKGNNGFEGQTWSPKKKSFFLIFAGLTTIVAITLFVIALTSNNDPEPIITPLSKQQAQNHNQPLIQEATYYVNISQRFLIQAEELSKNTNQTAEDKEAILIAVQNSLETINDGISNYPKDDRLYAQRAKIYQGIVSFSPNALEAAIADLEQARQLSPQNPTYPKTQSQILARMGRYQEASLYAEIAYKIEPYDLQSLTDLCQIQVKAGQVSEAIQSYKTLASLLPKDSQELAIVEDEIISLERLLAQAKNSQGSQLYLASEPTQAAPVIENAPADINLLPQEQASLPDNLIIASPEEENNNRQTGETDLNAIAGQTTILAGDSEVTIYNNNLTAENKINLSPDSDTDNQILYLKNKVTHPDSGSPYFIVTLSAPLDHDLDFRWWILN